MRSPISNPLDAVEARLREAYRSRDRHDDPSDHRPGLLLALHILREVGEEYEAACATKAPEDAAL